ncbi:MAG: hypothetical protein ACK5CA_08455 [Cyanobacteriota bacterium]|jgi:hypothetical protein
MVNSGVFWGMSAILLMVQLPTQAETCAPLSLLGGQGSEVTKTVSGPTIPAPFGIKIKRNNWNTDWAVPGGRKFKKFVATIVSEDGGSFDIRMFLKYSDQTNEEFFNQNSQRLEPGQPLNIEAAPRPEDNPFLVNVFVNGLPAIGQTYRASVVACL